MELGPIVASTADSGGVAGAESESLDPDGSRQEEVGAVLYRELLEEFISQLPQQTTDLDAAATIGDVPAARYIAHKLKGISLDIGAIAMHGLAERILLLREDEVDLIRPIVDDIGTEAQRLQHLYGRAGETLESEVGSTVYRELLDAFMGHLAEQIVDLDAAAAMGDIPGARYVAHQLKGTALDFGAVALHGLAVRILLIGKDQLELLGPVVDDIAGEADRLQNLYGNDGGTLEREVGPEIYQKLLGVFMAHLAEQINDLDAAAADGDIPSARYVAHQIAGTALDFGAVVLHDLAERLLLIGKDQVELLQPVVDDIGTEVIRLRAADPLRERTPGV